MLETAPKCSEMVQLSCQKSRFGQTKANGGAGCSLRFVFPRSAIRIFESLVSFEEPTEYAGPYGQLTPTGGGDPIPLKREKLLIGRRGTVDIQLKFPNISSQHCRMTLEQGYWFIKDLNSRNGIKVDDKSVQRKRADPGCKVSIAKHHYTLEYDPQQLGAYGPPPADDNYLEEMMRTSLMDRAGLSHRKKKSRDD